VPCYNEIEYIERFIRNVFSQHSFDEYVTEIIIADGMSTDGTLEYLSRITQEDCKLKVIQNAGRIVSTGMNDALELATGQIIIRMDVHTLYAVDYIKKCVEVLTATNAANVGGPQRAIAVSYVQNAIRLAHHSKFAVGGGKSHDVEYEGPADTVYLGCWPRQIFSQIGYFDETLVRNQDDELNYRIIQYGGTIWQSPGIVSWYFPRKNLKKLFRQYFEYGYWKVYVIRKHKLPSSIRQLIPGLFVFSVITLFFLGAINALSWRYIGFWIASYLMLTFAASLLTCAKAHEPKYLPVMPLVFICYHFGYGSGFLLGIVSLIKIPRFVSLSGK
jgi:succinoglycan biosynthesis protein ExoA